MKFIILAVSLALVSSAPQRREPIAILRQDSQISSDGYQWAYETANGITAEERGYLKQLGSAEQAGTAAEGQFQYTAPDGQRIHLVYTADENGFRPQGAHLPTPPPIPAEIQRALAVLANAAPST